MSRQTEEVEVILRELRAYGLKGQVENRSKHIEVYWQYPDGRSRSHICPASGSDCRGWLNSRARVRRWLREDGIQPPAPEKRVLERALNLPSPEDSGVARLERVEKDNEALLDWVAELQETVTVLQKMLSQVNVSVRFGDVPEVSVAPPEEDTVAQGSFPAPVPAPTEPPVTYVRQGVSAADPSPPGFAHRQTKKQLVWALLQGGTWVHKGLIEKETKLPSAHVSNTLHILKSEGYVENGMRGYWRKKPHMNGTAISPQLPLGEQP